MLALDKIINAKVELDKEEREIVAVPDLLAEHLEIK